MSKISLYVWGLGFGVLGVVGGLYVHTLVKNLLIKFLMMLFLVAKGCKFDSCVIHACYLCITPIFSYHQVYLVTINCSHT